MCSYSLVWALVLLPFAMSVIRHWYKELERHWSGLEANLQPEPKPNPAQLKCRLKWSCPGSPALISQTTVTCVSAWLEHEKKCLVFQATEFWGGLLGSVSFLIQGRNGLLLEILPLVGSLRLLLACLSDSVPQKSRSWRLLHQPSHEPPTLPWSVLSTLSTSVLQGCSPCDLFPDWGGDSRWPYLFRDSLPHILSGSSVAFSMSRIWTLSWVLKLVPCLGFPPQWGQPLTQCPRQNAWSSFISAHSFIHAGMKLWGATLCRILCWEYRQRKVWTHCRGAYILGGIRIIIPPSRGPQVLQCVSLPSPHSHQVTLTSSPNHCSSLPPRVPTNSTLSHQPSRFSSKLVTNLIFLNKIYVTILLKNLLMASPHLLDKSICSLASKTVRDWGPANLTWLTSSAPPHSLFVLGLPMSCPTHWPWTFPSLHFSTYSSFCRSCASSIPCLSKTANITLGRPP